LRAAISEKFTRNAFTLRLAGTPDDDPDEVVVVDELELLEQAAATVASKASAIVNPHRFFETIARPLFALIPVLPSWCPAPLPAPPTQS
jgi:hypothetical protein